MIDPAAILALISDLTSQLAQVRAENEELRNELKQGQQQS